MSTSNQLFCSKPFKWFEVFQGNENEIGEIYMCCPSWLATPIGHLQYQSVEEIWNGSKAQDIRRSILDGSFDFCSRSTCPYLQSVTGPVQRVEDVQDKELRAIIENKLTILPYGPQAINFSYDKSCNLSCPSCRTELIVEMDKKDEILKIQDKIKNSSLLKDAQVLYITGSGDPFGSPFFRKFLQTLQPDDMPNLIEIFLHTNALLWTNKVWSTIPQYVRNLIRSTEISIDAATEATYSINRRGGSFEKLLKNLHLVGALRKSGHLRQVRISMVVQENNFIEMTEFVRLGKRFNFDSVFFSRLVNWGTFSEDEFRRRAIHVRAHPRHSELVAVLRDPIFKEPIVDMGNLTELVG